MWLVTRPGYEFLTRYTLIFMFLIILILSSIINGLDIYVLFQIFSLISIFLFSIAYFESQNPKKLQLFFQSTVLIYSVVLLASIVIIKTNPSMAYTIEYWSGHKRYSGMFGEPGSMGTVSGLVFGLSLFAVKNKILKSIFILLAVTCLILTLSRTFWVSTVFALFATFIFYVVKKHRVVIFTSSVLVVLVTLFLTIEYKMNDDQIENYTRIESIKNLSGRTILWQSALKPFFNSPIVGYGFTVGADGFKESKGYFKSKGDGFSDRATLHNGYVQSLLDSGVLGTIFYVSIILFATFKLYAYDRMRKYKTSFFVLNYYMVANMGESLIYSASSFESIFYWMVATHVLGLRKNRKNVLN